MFVHGGISASGICSGDVYILDLATRIWSCLDAGLHHGPCCFSHSLVATRESLIAVGGCPGHHKGRVRHAQRDGKER